ncbi:pentatricopeptide repeat-containing protein 2, mitochondrial [Lasioglossum baleicum]|uniref:pentatricopeptide repeat-containing protein 2, mitochondrial n=1 Tax=Lasioglossum baleicum TaxID=434251 RepID=UPI003FCDF2F3
MALSIRGFCRLNLGLVSNVFSKNNILNVGVRYMYTEKALGITSYESTRQIYRNQFISIESTFRSKMKEVCDSTDGVIFTEDLKAMLHLIQKNEDDLVLIRKMIEKYQASNKDLKFGSYVFGTVVMRMYYYLNEPKTALDTFNEVSQTSLFNQRTSVNILMCLLYKNNMYAEIRELFNFAINNEEWKEVTKNCLLVLCSACYKENTPESFECALNSWRKVSDIVYRPPARSTAITSALAIKQNAPDVALELIAAIQKQQYITVRCLKVLAYMNLQKYVQIIPLFKHLLETDNSSPFKHTFYSHVIDELEENIKNTNVEGSEELLQLINEIRRRDQVTPGMRLEESLLRPKTFMFARQQEPLTVNRNNMRNRNMSGMRSNIRL